MRQPEVAGRSALRLLLAVLLALPGLYGLWTTLLAAAFLAEFLTAGAWPALSRLIPAPRVAALEVPGVAVDRYAPPTVSGRLLRAPAPLLLVHGVTPEGKDDPRARHAAMLLARAGFDVAVPTVPGLTAGRLRPGDVEPVVATLAARDAPTVVIGVSIGAGPALLAAADARVRDRVREVLTLGGYARAEELLRFYLTGDYGFAGQRGHTRHDPAQVEAFLRANADLVDDSVQRLRSARGPVERDAALAALSPRLRELLAALSPAAVLGDVRARLVLVHGRADSAVPYTESLRLAAARPARTRVVLVGVVGHVERRGFEATVAAARDLVALWTVIYGLLARS